MEGSIYVDFSELDIGQNQDFENFEGLEFVKMDKIKMKLFLSKFGTQIFAKIGKNVKGFVYN